ncbi:MAG TPA: hypothetical protein VMG82_21710 [Candidatus Sulfotelmatobacter sp.]|nr:hypothetical protein [Candidatus Sulfotelmatobacter sp.]
MIVPDPPPGVQVPPVTGAASAVPVPAMYTAYCAFALFDVSIPSGHGLKWIVLLPAVPRLSEGVCTQFQLEVTYRAFARLLIENCVPAGCTTFWLATGAVDTFPVPPPPPQAPQVAADVPLPSRHAPAVAVPAPSSLAGTSPG